MPWPSPTKVSKNAAKPRWSQDGRSERVARPRIPGSGSIISLHSGGDMSEDNPAFRQRTEDLYVARAVAEDTAPGVLSLTFVDLVRYLSDMSASLTADQWRLCREDPRVRADYDALKRNLSVAELPQAAAASQGDLEERTFPGGRLRIRPSALAGQVYLILTLDRVPTTPRILLVEGKDGEV